MKLNHSFLLVSYCYETFNIDHCFPLQYQMICLNSCFKINKIELFLSLLSLQNSFYNISIIRCNILRLANQLISFYPPIHNIFPWIN